MRIDSCESFAVETPIFIASQADSPASLEFRIHANHATKVSDIAFFFCLGEGKGESEAPGGGWPETGSAPCIPPLGPQLLRRWPGRSPLSCISPRSSHVRSVMEPTSCGMEPVNEFHAMSSLSYPKHLLRLLGNASLFTKV